MIGFRCPKDCPLCEFCNSCAHICLGECLGIRRAKAIEARSRPVKYYSDDEIERAPLVRKADFCDECRRPYDVTHPLQRFCSTECGRKDRNRRQWSKRTAADSAKERRGRWSPSDAKP